MKRKADGSAVTQKKRAKTQPTVASLQRQLTVLKGTEELKYIDTSLGATPYPLAGTGVLLLLNGLVQGNDAVNRIGRKVRMVSIETRISFNLSQTSVSNGVGTRTIIFFDKQANGAAPVAADYLLTDNGNANRNLNNRDRFITIMDEVRESASGFCLMWKRYDKLTPRANKTNWETIFNGGNAGTIADIQSGSLYMLTYLLGTVTTAEGVTTGRVRVRFNDA